MLLDICMSVIRKFGQPDITFKNKKWEEICKEFNKHTDKNYNQTHLELEKQNVYFEN